MRRVAITGFGVVSPIGTGRDAFLTALATGVSGIGPITHFDASTFDVQLAAEVKELIPLPEAVAAVAAEDPKVGFAYAACMEALAMAGISAMDTATVLHLATSLEIFDLRKITSYGQADLASVATCSLTTDAPPLQIPLDTAANLIATDFGRPGQSLTSCSACAAGTQAIGHGFQAVRSGRFDLAVCGGFDSMINPLGVGGFQLLQALTTDNDRGASACRPFAASRNGAVLGEGAAVFVLEPMDRLHGRTPLAEVLGYGSSLDAYKLSAPDPEGDGAFRAMAAALADAGLEPGDIDHINTHGTGTQLNDEVEAKAIRRLFANTWEDIPIAATKSMTGHLIAAAGAIETAACLLPLTRNLLPPNPSLEKVGRGCELKHITAAGSAFTGNRVLTNSFGFGGQNAALILGRAQE